MPAQKMPKRHDYPSEGMHVVDCMACCPSFGLGQKNYATAVVSLTRESMSLILRDLNPSPKSPLWRVFVVLNRRWIRGGGEVGFFLFFENTFPI